MSLSQAFHKIQLNMCHPSINWSFLKSRRNLQLTEINSSLER